MRQINIIKQESRDGVLGCQRQQSVMEILFTEPFLSINKQLRA